MVEETKKKNTILYGGGRSNAGMYMAMATAGLMLVGGGVALWYFLKPKASDQDKIREYIEIERPGELLNDSFAAGDTLQYRVNWTNNGDESLNVEFKFGVRNHDWGARYETNQTDKVITMPAGESGSTVLTRAIPSDWVGYEFDYRVLVSGGDMEGTDIIEEKFNLQCSDSSNPSENELEILNVEPVEELVPSGSKAKAQVRLRNIKGISISKKLRLDTRSISGDYDWDSGSWVSLYLAAGAEKTIELQSVTFGYATGKAVAAKIQVADDQGPIWGQVNLVGSEPYQIFTCIDNETKFNPSYANAEAIQRVSSNPDVSEALETGDSWAYTLRFEHKGPASSSYKIGLMLKYADRNVWVSKTLNLPAAAEYTEKTVTLNGTFAPGSTPHGRRIEGLKAIQKSSKPFYDDGKNMILANWDWVWYVG